MALPVHDNIGDFAAPLPPKGSLLALDVSKLRVGLAGSDPDRTLATPLFTFKRRKWAQDVAKIKAAAEERGTVGLVLGLPINMDGSEGPMAIGMRDRAKLLEQAFDLPILLQDERLSTETVREAIAEGWIKRPKPGEPIDHFAAKVILEDALNALKRHQP